MPTMFDVPRNDLINALAKELQDMPEINPPEWSAVVKTGMSRERPPLRDDWWFVRTASVLLAVRSKGPIGVAKLRRKYGGRKNRGHKPDKFYKGSGNIIRKVLQQLESIGFLKQVEKSSHKGRFITPKGTSFVDKIAGSLYTPIAKKEAKSVEAKKEVPKEKVEEKPNVAEAKPVEAKKAEEKKEEPAKKE